MTGPLGPPPDDLFKLAVELSPSGMLAVDSEGRILLVNREIERLFGYRRDELVGRPIETLVPERFRSQHPLDRRGYFGNPQARPMGIGRDLYGLRRDGTEVPVEIGLNPIQTDRGLVVLASIVDIGARKRAEQRFQAAFESSPSGMVMTDRLGQILLVNREAERLFGFPRHELVGRPVEMLVPERFRSRHPGERAGFFGRPQARPMGAGRELFGLRKDGTEIPVEIGLTPIHTDEGLFVLSSIVDITERRRSEDRLRQVQKMEAIGTLAGGIAHDFNNILMGIVGHADLALMRPGLESQMRSDLEQVVKAADRGRQLVQRILTFSRQRESARAPIRLDVPLQEALQLLRASLPATIEIRSAIDPGTPSVLGDETQIHQVIMNLATNAAHAMPGGGTLEVRLEPCQVTRAYAQAHPPLEPGLHARLSVRDSGHGMTEDQVARVFEPFYTTRVPGEGTGLGLSVVHGIVVGHRGAIELRSRPGEGTCAEVTLPAATPAVEAPADPAGADDRRAARHILLVEDERVLGDMMRRQIEALGHRVTLHDGSVEALADFRARPAAFDLMITDNTMPKMTGLELAREILAVRPDLPVMMISGLADSADAPELRARGIRRILPKPHRARELAEAIQELLG